MFNFDKFKLTMSDSLTLGFSASSTILDYYMKADEADDQLKLIEFNKKVLKESQAAKENNIYYNTYLTNSALEAEGMRNEIAIKKSASEVVAQGAATGMEGAALEALTREAQAQAIRARGEAEFQQDRTTQAAQVQLDESTASYNAQAQELAYKEDQIEEPSIFASVIKTGSTVVSTMKQAEKDRLQQEYYSSLNTPKSKGNISTIQTK